ncbi:Crp/Fnr family transcriptional regulator [Oscillatoria sp. CS-180]|uniref:Crp/Fnr family transcriptional regulator n=1 Tax=Oscillatoria sp. CS-180 TaxID=3021720 RepID=UPI00232ECE5F|nr:Crp/Fnr family transcriptional regulator [Oscillatoria sp. CS-180]MDB9529312.1 Crp/Fnr family transcriptional regulator [Oscillatoria sp. CS-180]
MQNSTVELTSLDCPRVRTFKRREIVPLQEDTLWQIQSGTVRLLTISEDGAIITLGFWGVGDSTGYPLVCIQPCYMECLTTVEAARLNINQCWNMNQVMLAHISQMQELMRIRHGQTLQRIQLLLNWLASKFGSRIDQGYLIHLRLTHQQIAEAIGSSRVTVTRLIHELERTDVISYSERHHIILHSC